MKILGFVTSVLANPAARRGIYLLIGAALAVASTYGWVNSAQLDAWMKLANVLMTIATASSALAFVNVPAADGTPGRHRKAQQ